jgi:type VI secretion system protein ImpA
MVECASSTDLETLLACVPGDSPAGDGSAYIRGLRDQFQELRREERPEDFDDATRPPVLKKPDWPGVVALAEKTLRAQTKDLRVACHLVEGWTQVDGFAGLARGLELIRQLIEQCWDRLNPPLENDDDGESRAEPLANMLDDPIRGISLPTTVRLIPLIGSGGASYSLNHWTRLREDPSPEAQDERSRALARLDVDAMAARGEDLDLCLQTVDSLVAAMDGAMGASAPALSNLKSALEECRVLLQGEIAQKSPAPPDSPTDEEAADGPELPGGAAGPERAMNSREQAYAQLERAASLLSQLEPHSPVPYMIQRAVQFGRLPFPRLMEQLIRNEGVLSELNRELGVESTAGDGDS